MIFLYSLLRTSKFRAALVEWLMVLVFKGVRPEVRAEGYMGTMRILFHWG